MRLPSLRCSRRLVSLGLLAQTWVLSAEPAGADSGGSVAIGGGNPAMGGGDPNSKGTRIDTAEASDDSGCSCATNRGRGMPWAWSLFSAFVVFAGLGRGRRLSRLSLARRDGMFQRARAYLCTVEPHGAVRVDTVSIRNSRHQGRASAPRVPQPSGRFQRVGRRPQLPLRSPTRGDGRWH